MYYCVTAFKWLYSVLSCLYLAANSRRHLCLSSYLFDEKLYDLFLALSVCLASVSQTTEKQVSCLGHCLQNLDAFTIPSMRVWKYNNCV